jgi:hypothetical protein
LAPYKSIEKKINSLEKLEDITAFEIKLKEAITKKKQEKLTVIVNEAITEIKKEIGQSRIELGENKDYETRLKNTNDPDTIELIKQNLIKLIREQKSSERNEEISQNFEPDKSTFFDPETITIIALIIVPLGLIGFVVLRI